ncbi:MAG TPA: leucyl/phenylalanyl-tRNA--protein transferase [Chthonomonadales bacterium]|nr:leucyl/phenylalanyl-tRNA--protein transferase [Chthonomonadales bacterium]
MPSNLLPGIGSTIDCLKMYLTFTPEGVELAYRHGIFPMADEVTGEIWWFRPDPRAIIPLDAFHISRSLAKTIRKRLFEIRIDTDFEGVMAGCADRPEGTWISREFIEVYGALHRAGKAHSVEAWRNGRLAGGVYGVALGGAFMAESMFHRERDASKVALAALVARLKERGYMLLDVQYLTPHLASLGAVEIPRSEYEQRLQIALQLDRRFN